MKNPFRAIPFPAAGGAYRVQGGRLVPDAEMDKPLPEPEKADSGPATKRSKRAPVTDQE